jgi:lipoate-protein ligase B
MTAINSPIRVVWLGRMPYADAWEQQKQLVAQIAAGQEPDHLLLVEHPPTYTFGRRGKQEHLLLDGAQLAAAGITVHHVDRGGDVTYHGPGQLVGYPLLHLQRQTASAYPDLHQYLRDLEQTLIDTLATFGVHGWRYQGYTGVWVDHLPAGSAAGKLATPHKIAAIGIKVNGQGVSSHGFALNVAPNLDHFGGIVPCGIAEHGVTSLAEVTGERVTLPEVVPALLKSFAHTFQRTLTYDAAAAAFDVF